MLVKHEWHVSHFQKKLLGDIKNKIKSLDSMVKHPLSHIKTYPDSPLLSGPDKIAWAYGKEVLAEVIGMPGLEDNHFI